MMHQYTVSGMHMTLYAFASETFLLCTPMMYISGDQFIATYREVSDSVGISVLWCHYAGWCIPLLTPAEMRYVLKSHKPIWLAVKTHVAVHGLLPQIKLFRHVLQTFQLQ